MSAVFQLLEINLSYNRISDVNKAFFDGVKNNINSINLGHNELTTVPASGECRSRRVKRETTRARAFAALRGFRQLMALHLHDNKIHTLDALSFMNLPVMSLLNLANNRIRTISRQAFINVPMLRFLYLTDNSIESVAPHQFASFDQLEMLDLTSNRIANLTDGAFAQLAALKQLYLGSNRIADIQAGAFLNSSITVLILEDNQLRDVTEVAFRNMKSLQQLSLKQNRVSSRPAASLANKRRLQIKNVAQSAFHETPALVIINLSRNEIFDLAPSTFVPLQNVLLIDLSHNQIVRVPYGAFGRRVVTVLLQGAQEAGRNRRRQLRVAENPLVCTEHIHMLQQGVGISTPSAEDTVCGAQRHVNETIAAAQPQTAAMPAATNRLGSQQPATAPPAARPSLPPTNTILHNEDTLRDAFRQAELEQHRFEASGGLTQSPRHDGEPKLDPTVPPIADANMPILQRPTVGGAQGSELPIRRLHSRPAAYRTDSIAGDDSARPLIVSGSAGDHSADTRPLAAPAASTAATPHNATRPSGRLVGVDGSTTPDIANIPGRIYPLPVPFLPDKTPRMMQPAISLGSQTLPPSIVIAPTSSAASSASASSKVEPTSGLIAATSPADQRLQKSPPLPTASTSPRASTSNASAPPIRPIVGGKLNAASEVFDVETLTKPVAPTSDAALDAASASAAAADNERAILQGDRSLSTLLIIICLSTVGVVLLAVGVGMCVVHRRRGTAPFIGSAASSTTARSTVPYGTAATSLPTTIVHTHPTQQYLTQNQFSASQLSTMQRAR